MSISSSFTALELQSLFSTSNGQLITLAQAIENFQTVLPPESVPIAVRGEIAKERFRNDSRSYVRWSDGKEFLGSDLVGEVDGMSKVGKIALHLSNSQTGRLYDRLKQAIAKNDPRPVLPSYRSNDFTKVKSIRTAGKSPVVLFVAPFSVDSEVPAAVHLRQLRTDPFAINSKLATLVFSLEAQEENLISFLLSPAGKAVQLLKATSHGSSQTVSGFGGSTLLSSSNSGIWGDSFRDRVIHVFACESGMTLGNDMVDSSLGKAKAFIGYQTEILSTKRSQAEAAEFDHWIDLMLVLGHHCRESVDIFTDMIKKYINQQGSNPDDYVQEVIDAIGQLRDSVVLHGDGTARL
jgi:hypothetical protein